LSAELLPADRLHFSLARRTLPQGCGREHILLSILSGRNQSGIPPGPAVAVLLRCFKRQDKGVSLPGSHITGSAGE